MWQDRDETHNFPQKYDAELVREALRPGVRDEIRIKEVDTVMQLMRMNSKEGQN